MAKIDQKTLNKGIVYDVLTPDYVKVGSITAKNELKSNASQTAALEEAGYTNGEILVRKEKIEETLYMASEKVDAFWIANGVPNKEDAK